MLKFWGPRCLVFFFCCGGPFCICWWRGPDFVFDEVCADFFDQKLFIGFVSPRNMNAAFFCCGGPDFGFCFCFVLKTFNGCCFYSFFGFCCAHVFCRT